MCSWKKVLKCCLRAMSTCCQRRHKDSTFVPSRLPSLTDPTFSKAFSYIEIQANVTVSFPLDIFNSQLIFLIIYVTGCHFNNKKADLKINSFFCYGNWRSAHFTAPPPTYTAYIHSLPGQHHLHVQTYPHSELIRG